MSKQKLGRFVKLSVREAWLSEASDFTPWLARPENLQQLAGALGLELETHSQESRVGPFRADILCRDKARESWVLIENQLERTDHSHLGQLLTYAAGLEAVTIVWVAERFTEEHRAALDWLNEHTDETVNFFGVEIELWRIGDSSPAPRFNVVAKPNEWTRYVAESARKIDAAELSGRAKLQFEYWTAFLAFLDSEAKGNVRHNRKPGTYSWLGFPVGRSEFRLWVEIRPGDKYITAGMTFRPPHAAHYFKALRKVRTDLEAALGFRLQWEEHKGQQHSYFFDYMDCNPEERLDWPKQHRWMASRLETFQKKLPVFLDALPPPEGAEA